MKRSISILFAATMLSMTSSCQLLQIPAIILQRVGGVLNGAGGIAGLPGIGLTDEVPQPALPVEVKPAAQEDSAE